MPPGPHQAPGSLAWCRHLTPPKLAGPPRSVCDRGCSALGSPGGPMCEGGGALISARPQPGAAALRNGSCALGNNHDFNFPCLCLGEESSRVMGLP